MPEDAYRAYRLGAHNSLGLFGVLLFFVHTSLVLMYSMERSGLQGAFLLKDFYIRRIFRILPLSILAIAAAVALHLDSDINGIAGLSYGHLPGKMAILSQVLMVQNLVHVKSIVNVLWSLPFEVQMYLFLPFLFAWVRRKRVFWSLLALWIVSLLGALAQPHFAALDRASLLLFVPCFLPGVIAFAVPRIPSLSSYLWPISIFALVAVFTLNPVLPMAWALCLVLGLLIPFFREIQTRSIRTMSNRVATYSYGIYISHQFCIWLALGVLAARPIWLRLGVLSTSLVVLPIPSLPWHRETYDPSGNPVGGAMAGKSGCGLGGSRVMMLREAVCPPQPERGFFASGLQVEHHPAFGWRVHDTR